MNFKTYEKSPTELGVNMLLSINERYRLSEKSFIFLLSACNQLVLWRRITKTEITKGLYLLTLH